MSDEEYFWELQRTLSAEFSKYVLAHPELDDQIPNNAQIVFHIKGNTDFNNWSDQIRLAPPLASRLINPHLKVANM